MSRPTTGVRYDILLSPQEAQEEEGLVYRGHARLPDRDIPLEVRVSAKSEARASLNCGEALPEAERRELEREAAALVRAATRGIPPRRITRWRA